MDAIEAARTEYLKDHGGFDEAMRYAIAAWCEARAKELTAESFSVGEANYAARLENDAVELRKGRNDG
jgi:hypothetical protein